MGYGRADASDGAVFPYVFPLPATYWAQADALVNYVGQQEGGLDKLKGKKIALVYHDIAYGKEPIPMLEALAAEIRLRPSTNTRSRRRASSRQATWLQIRQQRPDWLFMWGWGVMNSTAIKEAAAIGYPHGPLHRRVVVGRRA